MHGYARALALGLLIAGCKQEEDPPEETGPELPTGWFTDTAAPPETAEPPDTGPDTCEAHIVETEPAPGESEWYWRDAFTVRTAAPGDYPATLSDEAGVEIALSSSVDETGTVITLTPDQPLAPDTDHLLRVTDCGGSDDIDFRTSRYGLPLEGEPSTLVGRTFQVDLAAAEWTEPKGFGTILALYFTDPILLGVQWADDHIIDFIGAPGFINAEGSVLQNLNRPSWDLPSASFEDSPYFEIDGAEIVLYVDSETAAPVFEVHIEGTLAPDGRSFTGGVISGLGDTRTLGSVINDPSDPNAICEFASTLGVKCVPCPDGEPYCMSIYANQVEGTELPGVVVIPVAAEP